MVLSILIRPSKTDQEKKGVTRSLMANTAELCPVQALDMLRKWYHPSKHPGNTPFFPTGIRAKLVHAMKWASAADGIPSAVVNTHSLRAGGATALFAEGLDWISIQRWGRWRSFIFHEYTWHDADRFLHFGERIASTSGVNKYLAEVAPQQTLQPFDSMPDFHTGRSYHEPQKSERCQMQIHGLSSSRPLGCTFSFRFPAPYSFLAPRSLCGGLDICGLSSDPLDRRIWDLYRICTDFLFNPIGFSPHFVFGSVHNTGSADKLVFITMGQNKWRGFNSFYDYLYSFPPLQCELWCRRLPFTNADSHFFFSPFSARFLNWAVLIELCESMGFGSFFKRILLFRSLCGFLLFGSSHSIVVNQNFFNPFVCSRTNIRAFWLEIILDWSARFFDFVEVLAFWNDIRMLAGGV